MATIFGQAFSRIKDFWGRINLSQRLIVAGMAALLVTVFFIMILAMNRSNMQSLYTNLSAEDANRVVKTLQAQKIKYELAENGSVIMVPEDQVYQLRIQIAGEGSLVGQGIGFEIFDEVKVGLTDFAQKINYQRALQGELSRTISEFDAVDSVRVHLVIPQRSLFIEEQQRPSASVVLKLRDGKKMDSKDVTAIVNLVTMAVEGLIKERVSITDSTGKVLFRPDEEGSIYGLTNAQFEHRMVTQQHFERRIEDLLAPVIGPGRVIAKVNAELDFSQKTIKKEMFDPNVTVVRSETRMEEQQQGRANLEAGVPDVNFRGDGLTGSVSAQNSSREQRQANYEINREEQNIIGSVGDVHRLTVAVVVDGIYAKNDKGEQIFTPRSDAELRNIRQLVSNAVGFDSARGDTIEVSCIPFGIVESEPEKDITGVIADYAIRIGKPFLNAILIFLFLLIVVRPVIMALIRPKVEGEMLEELAGLPMGEERLALVESDEEELDAIAILEKIEDIKAHALHLCEQNMEQAMGILRNWMKKDEPSKEKVPARAA